MRRGLALLAALALAGCEGLPSLGGAVQDAPPVTALALADGAVTIAAPEGYCIDGRASRPPQGFVIMAGCALVSSDARMPVTDGLITVQIGAEGTAGVTQSPSTLRNLLATAEGAALLSSNGDPTAISVDALESDSRAVYVHFTDSAAPPKAGLEQVEWRAFFDLGDRLATVTLRGFERAPIDAGDGLRLLRASVETIRRATEAADPGTDG